MNSLSLNRFKLLDGLSFFTDEKHEQELKVEIDKRNLFLQERNKAKDQIAKYDRAEEKYH